MHLGSVPLYAQLDSWYVSVFVEYLREACVQNYTVMQAIRMHCDAVPYVR
jgi:hypothetical protein